VEKRGWNIAAYVDEQANAREGAGGVPVVSFETWRQQIGEVSNIVTALDPDVRRRLVERIIAHGGVIAPAAAAGWISRKVSFGDGTLIGGDPLYVGTTTAIGRHTIVMTPASIGHDCVIGDFVTIYPSAAISGHVVIEDGVTVGIGAVIVNGSARQPLRIGHGARISSGAVVTKSLRAGVLVTGNPGIISGPAEQ